MSFKIYRHAKVRVPKSLEPKEVLPVEIKPAKNSFKVVAQKSVGGIFALSGTALAATPFLLMAGAPFDLAGIFIGSLAGAALSVGPVLGSYGKTNKYIPFKQAKVVPKPVEPVYFEPYRNWDEVFVSYADRLVDKHIECDTPVGFVTLASRQGADMYKIRQEREKGNSNISWSGLYGEVSEYDQEIFFRSKDEVGSVLFSEEIN